MNPSPLLLDTHVWVKHQVEPHLLRKPVVQAIDDAALVNQVFVSVISVWELALLEKAGKVIVPDGLKSWVQQAFSKPGITLLPYTPAIAIESVYLPAPMHKDPADRILIASARIEKLTIVTSDVAMLAFAKTTGLPRLRA